MSTIDRPGSRPEPPPGETQKILDEAPVAEKIVHITDDTFELEVLQSQAPVLVDYWAEWCGPCKMIAPVLDQIASDYEGASRSQAQHRREPGHAAEVQRARNPTLMLFKNGTLEAQKVGALSKTQSRPSLTATSENG
jgi:thioredoxin 1